MRIRWMFRVVDVADAVARRGFPSALSADALITVDDPERPANTGTWRLEVSGGSGTASAAEGEGAGLHRQRAFGAVRGGPGLDAAPVRHALRHRRVRRGAGRGVRGPRPHDRLLLTRDAPPRSAAGACSPCGPAQPG
ncbi:sterol carrier protein domain-containing protein [Nonomuraea dietziae]|uniref:sterol carrier protein domain-containing protein n=1 Tax=Nonomuraea dietziae TaxID=65515 RepID=UPI0031DB642E